MTRVPAARTAIAATPITKRRMTWRSLEIGGNFFKAGLYAGLVLIAARSAGDAGSANHLVADFDRQRAARGGEAGEILGAHLGILFQSLFHFSRGDAEGARGKGLLEAVLHGMRPGTVAADLDQHLAVAADNGGRDAIAICAMVSAMAADTSLRVSNCALAGVAKAQASAMAPQRYDSTGMMKSSP